ncbi:MAG: hypothetical protein EBU27_03485, partial [Opitutae bacterium]|nr:hypothetical protein [Opitutae bacterium]
MFLIWCALMSSLCPDYLPLFDYFFRESKRLTKGSKFKINLLMKFLFLLSLFGGTFLMAMVSTPIPYSGKVSVDGINYHGEAHFAFSIQDGTGSVHWRNGESANSTILVKVQNGRYSVLLGGQGMKALSPQLFLNHSILFLHVRFDNGDGQGLRHLGPDQRIHSTPHSLVAEVAKSALSAETAKSAEVAETAKAVEAGAISKQMLGQDVLSDLNRTVTATQMASNTITTAQLNDQILKYLKPEITLSPQAPGLIFGGQTVTLHSRAEGKYLNYQWH